MFFLEYLCHTDLPVPSFYKLLARVESTMDDYNITAIHQNPQFRP